MSSEKLSQPQRVVIYIDGFNLYFGLREKGWKNLYWLNVYKLGINSRSLKIQNYFGFSFFNYY